MVNPGEVCGGVHCPFNFSVGLESGFLHMHVRI